MRFLISSKVCIIKIQIKWTYVKLNPLFLHYKIYQGIQNYQEVSSMDILNKNPLFFSPKL